MTNKEINLKIANIKWAEQLKNNPGKRIVTNEAGSVRVVGDSKWWYWAFDINQSWDLIDEMPESEKRKVEENFSDWAYMPAIHACLAWLEWKEKNDTTRN